MVEFAGLLQRGERFAGLAVERLRGEIVIADVAADGVVVGQVRRDDDVLWIDGRRTLAVKRTVRFRRAEVVFIFYFLITTIVCV